MFRRDRARGRVAVVRDWRCAIRARVRSGSATRRQGRANALLPGLAPLRLDERACAARRRDGCRSRRCRESARADAVALVAAIDCRMALRHASRRDAAARRRALLAGGWARDVAIDVDADGTIVSVDAGAPRDGAERVAGPAACRRCPTCTRTRSSARSPDAPGTRSAERDDSFWTWRQAMYAFLDRIDADAFEAIAAQAYVEMAKAGYAAVAEFHYVHHDPAGKPYADPAELAHAHRRRRGVAGHRAHAAAGVLRACRIRRRAATAGAAALRAHDRLRSRSSSTRSARERAAGRGTCSASRRTACAP